MSDNTINTAFYEWNRQVQLPGTIQLSEATDILQTFAGGLTDQEGDDWWNALGAEFQRLGFVNPGADSYVQLRNWALNNEDGANDAFDALIAAINALPESQPVNTQILIQNFQDDKANIPSAKTTVEGFKNGDRLVDGALDAGLNALDEYDTDIDARLTSLGA